MESKRICVIDDDESVREALPELLRQLGYEVRAFPSAHEFLASDVLEQTHCLILDVAMPGMSGPMLQLELQRLGKDIPIVFVTAQPNDSLRETVMGRGAAALLAKPFTEQMLLQALAMALPPAW